MDARHFDRLARSLTEAGSRRGLLGLLATLPVLGGLVALLDFDETDAKGRRKRRKKKHKHGKGNGRHRKGKKKQKCKAKSKVRTCANRCGTVKNNCKKRVDCGSCDCDPPCETCFTCRGEPGACVQDASGTPCGDAGQVCQPDGACLCVPDCTGKVCGSDGCTGTCAPGCPPNATCSADGASCACAGVTCDGACCAANQLCCNDTCVSDACCTNAECSGTTPVCDAAHTCVACTADSECGAHAYCLSDGSCQDCTVSCPSGDSAACGDALQAALDAGGTVYVCPGTYRGGFIVDKPVTVIGAGQGEDDASNTILEGDAAGFVMGMNQGPGVVELQRLRITGGTTGGGIVHSGIDGATLRMFDCTVAGNTSCPGCFGAGIATGGFAELTRCTIRENDATGEGGGIFTAGNTTLTDCLVEGNSAAGGGGIYVARGKTTLAGSTTVRDNRADATLVLDGGGGIFVEQATLEIAETCRVTENTAPAGEGGGIFNDSGTVTLQGADPSQIVVDNCPENCLGNVPKCAAGGFCPA